MSIATSIEKLSETLTNCKTNLKEKGVEADNIKISDVDEKITEIQAGSNLPVPWEGVIDRVEVKYDNKSDYEKIDFNQQISPETNYGFYVKIYPTSGFDGTLNGNTSNWNDEDITKSGEGVYEFEVFHECLGSTMSIYIKNGEYESPRKLYFHFTIQDPYISQD